MAPQEIHITTSHNSQEHAARVLSEMLIELTIRHAYIGGFAWRLLGSGRQTEDIDVLIEIPKDTLDLWTLREKMAEIDKRFTENVLKFYFVEDIDAFSEDSESQGPDETTKTIQSRPKKRTGIELLSRSKSNVLIETLSAGTLGLPDSVDLVYNVPSTASTDLTLPILHPTILILSKLQRWCRIYKSIRPKTLNKALTDSHDIDYLIGWLSRNGMLIAFDNYEAKNVPKERLVRHVRTYWEHKEAKEDEEVMTQLEGVLNEADKAMFLASASPKDSDTEILTRPT
ncbi:uncharacterized protein EV420DRAFT_1053050 [Desarmillaria tabescens]|uniref:Uncharacterized protein n=1 Tax=Armillaria tabescens TaxID=1929756 RepID=A0AA39NFC8_ARMTA|nr:uncharacterized protein EV420DRAFT_1053050 [Desarmillaria tabescens]KAK0464604.1 hypothetical protein EV420DRAFT_1053050 [Desarmillaria tabescens]